MLKETERLTERDALSGVARLKYKDGLNCGNFWFCPEGECNAHACDVAIAVERLAAYEDSKMTPEEVIRMKEKEKRRRKNNQVHRRTPV